MKQETATLTPYLVIARELGISRFVVAAIEKKALARVREAFNRLGYSDYVVPYVVHALSYADEDTPADRRRKRDRERYYRRKEKKAK